MNSEQLIKGNPEIFKLAPGDIDHLFRRSGVKGNVLSHFHYNAEQAATSSPSALFKPLAESPRLKQIARGLLEPDLKIEYNRGGAGAAADRYYVLLSNHDEAVVAQFVNAEGDLLLLLFNDWESFLAWWTDVYAYTGVAEYQTIFPKTMEIEVLVCALHCVDIYRRSYLESMLDYSSNLSLALTTQDFVQLIKRSLASKDKRWLLPTMFEITPGLKNSNIALKPEHLQLAQELEFVSIDDATLTLSKKSRMMGTEFITSWMGSIGWQATALINGEVRSLSTAFMAPTAFTNHLISFSMGAGGNTRFRHQACDREDLIKALSVWLQALRKAVGTSSGSQDAAPAPAPAADTPTNTSKPKFCGQCGAEIRAGKKFCTSCGTAV